MVQFSGWKFLYIVEGKDHFSVWTGDDEHTSSRRHSVKSNSLLAESTRTQKDHLDLVTISRRPFINRPKNPSNYGRTNFAKLADGA